MSISTKLCTNGELVHGAGPATGDLIGEVPEANAGWVDAAVQAAVNALSGFWGQVAGESTTMSFLPGCYSCCLPASARIHD